MVVHMAAGTLEIQGPDTGDTQYLTSVIGGMHRACVCLIRCARRSAGHRGWYVQVPAAGEIKDGGKLLDRVSKSTSVTGRIHTAYICMYMFMCTCTFMYTCTYVFH